MSRGGNRELLTKLLQWHLLSLWTDERSDFLYFFFFCEIEDVIADLISVGRTYLNILHPPSKNVCNSRLSLISGYQHLCLQIGLLKKYIL